MIRSLLHNVNPKSISSYCFLSVSTLYDSFFNFLLIFSRFHIFQQCTYGCLNCCFLHLSSFQQYNNHIFIRLKVKKSCEVISSFEMNTVPSQPPSYSSAFLICSMTIFKALMRAYFLSTDSSTYQGAKVVLVFSIISSMAPS